MFFFFKQKTAYEMRISDWSSDVCSSDLFMVHDPEVGKIMGYDRGILASTEQFDAYKPTDAPNKAIAQYEEDVAAAGVLGTITPHPAGADTVEAAGSDERRVGRECVSPCRSRWSPYH